MIQSAHYYNRGKRLFVLTIVTAMFAAAMSVCGRAEAAPDLTADENAWIQAISIFSTDAKANGMELAVERIVNPGSGVSPVAAEFKDGKCVIRLAVRGNPVSAKVQDLVKAPSAGAVARVASVAHEFGHCLHEQALERGTAGLPATHSADSEALADTYALLWMRANAPSHYQTAVMFFRKLREFASDKYAQSLDAIDRAESAQAEATIAAASVIYRK